MLSLFNTSLSLRFLSSWLTLWENYSHLNLMSWQSTTV